MMCRPRSVFKTPDSTPVEIGRLTLQGDADMQELFIDQDKLVEALEHLATTTPYPRWLDSQELALIQTSGDRVTIADRVIERAKYLLRDYRPGWTIVDTATPGCVRFDVFGSYQAVLATPPHHAIGLPFLGYAFLIDNVDLSDPDHHELVPDLIANRSRLSASQSSFLLADILNEQPAGHVDVYVERYFRYGNILTSDSLVNTLAQVVNHELGHNLGMNHTLAHVSFVANVVATPAPTGGVFAVVGLDSAGHEDPDALSPIDDIYIGWTLRMESGPNAGQEATIIDYVGATREFTMDVAFTAPISAGERLVLYHSYVLPSESLTQPVDMMGQGQDYTGELQWVITAEAVRMALGVDWDSLDAASALAFFREFVNRTAPTVWGDVPTGPLDYDPQDPYYLEPTMDTQSPTEHHGGILWLAEPAGLTYVDDVDFGSVLAETGNEVGTARSTAPKRRRRGCHRLQHHIRHTRY